MTMIINTVIMWIHTLEASTILSWKSFLIISLFSTRSLYSSAKQTCSEQQTWKSSNKCGEKVITLIHKPYEMTFIKNDWYLHSQSH